MRTDAELHHSCIRAAKGQEHAWYCTSQIADCGCNCSYEAIQLLRRHNHLSFQNIIQWEKDVKSYLARLDELIRFNDGI